MVGKKVLGLKKKWSPAEGGTSIRYRITVTSVLKRKWGS